MSHATRIKAAYGDGIGPEIMAASLHIIQSAGMRIETEVCDGVARYTPAQSQ
jgi:isocitrate dehydrogenase